ncbi:hypothetical protein ELI00_04710 [Rhizobium ruizarguesonis]|nr:hypothetical protein ELI00_04710 [Rhizobium ruizarguesonis]TBY82083.1 hypothetical protein E0H40_34060 [Rhizobium leguminosarum bv. viciae]
MLTAIDPTTQESTRSIINLPTLSNATKRHRMEAPSSRRRCIGVLERSGSRMSRKSVQRFCDNDMRKNKDLKRKERI